MRKCKLLSAILVVFVILSAVAPLTACHGGYALPEFSIPTDFNATEEVEITFWAKNENNKTQQQVYRDAVAEFEKLYPNINVTLKLYSDYNEIYKDVITNISTGTTPNICITYPDHIATYMTGNNVMVPLDGLMNDENWGLGSENLRFDAPKKDEIIPQFLAEGKINGVQYAIPFMRSTEACYINVDMVKALGYDGVPELITWDWIFEVSEAAMALGKDGDGNYKLNGQKVLIPFIYKSTDNMMIQMLKQKGAGYSTDDGEILIFNDETEDILYELADHTKTGAFSTFKISSYPGNYLNAGQCIFAIDSTAGATWMGPKAPQIDIAEENLIDCEIAVRAIPQYDTEAPQMISQGPSICIFNKENSKEVMASWIFVQYLLTNEVQIAYSQTEGYLPVTSKAHSSAEYQSYLSKSGEDNDLYYHVKIDAAKLLLDNLDNTFITPVFNGSASLRNAAGQMIEEVCKSIRRKQTVDDKYMKDLYERVSTLYHLDELNMKSGVKIDFGAMPKGSLALITVIGTVWVAIGAYYVVKLIKKHKNTE